jgi:hypothetical protein
VDRHNIANVLTGLGGVADRFDSIGYPRLGDERDVAFPAGYTSTLLATLLEEQYVGYLMLQVQVVLHTFVVDHSARVDVVYLQIPSFKSHVDQSLVIRLQLGELNFPVCWLDDSIMEVYSDQSRASVAVVRSVNHFERVTP